MIKCTVPADLLTMFPYDLAVAFPEDAFTRFSDGQTRVSVEEHDAHRLISALRLRAEHVSSAEGAAKLWLSVVALEAGVKGLGPQ